MKLQENRYFLPSRLAIEHIILLTHTPNKPEVSINCTKSYNIFWHFNNVATFSLRLPNSTQSYFIRVGKKVINK